MLFAVVVLTVVVAFEVLVLVVALVVLDVVVVEQKFDAALQFMR